MSLPIDESTPMKILAVLIEVVVQPDREDPLMQERGVLVEGGSVERKAEGEDRRKRQMNGL